MFYPLHNGFLKENSEYNNRTVVKWSQWLSGSVNGGGICIPMDLGIYNNLSSPESVLKMCFMHGMTENAENNNRMAIKQPQRGDGGVNGSGICIPMDLVTYNNLSSHSLTVIVCYIHCMVDLLKKLGI